MNFRAVKRAMPLQILLLIVVMACNYSLTYANETVRIKVGESITLRYPSEITSKTLAGMPAPVSNARKWVEVSGFNYSGVTIKGLASSGNSYAIIQVTYYYFKENPLLGGVYEFKGIYDYRVYVEEDSSGGGSTDKDPTGIAIPTEIAVCIGDSRSITPTIYPSGATTSVTWSTEDSGIATVSRQGSIKGVVSGVAEGQTRIVARTHNGYKASCLVNVEKPSLSLSVNLQEGTYRPGSQIRLTASEADADIYYTLDGTKPTETSSLYTSPIVLDKTTTVRAIAKKEGFKESNEINQVYTISKDAEVTFSGGKGTLSDPFLVSTGDELALVSEYKSCHFKQACDIDLTYLSASSSKGWLPIGFNYDPFVGSYDGNGFKISGLSTARSSEDVGLFGYIKNATIKNIILEEVAVAGGNNTAGLVGCAEKAKISGISVSGMVSGSDNVGGIVGNAISTVITESTCTCHVSGTNNVGGLLGRYEQIENYVGGSYKYSSSEGAFVDERTKTFGFKSLLFDGVADGTLNVGGIVGNIDAKNISKDSRGTAFPMFYRYIFDMTMTVEFSGIETFGKVNGKENCGGIIGYANLQVESNAGGMAGFFYEAVSQTSRYGESHQTVDAKTVIKLDNNHNSSIVSSSNIAGGLVGRIEKTSRFEMLGEWTNLSNPIGECQSDIGNSSNNGNVYVENDRCGGIVGQVSGVRGSGIIRNCVNSAERLHANNYCAGIVGFSESWKVDIEDCLSLGAVHAENQFAAGIVNASEYVYVNQCVSGNTSVSALEHAYLIGMSGENNLSSAATELIVENNSDTGADKNGELKTAEELFQGNTYHGIGWDLSKTWKIKEEEYFPYLRVQSNVVDGNNVKFYREEETSVVGGTVSSAGTVFVQEKDEVYSCKSNDDGTWRLKLPTALSIGDIVQVYWTDNENYASCSIFKKVGQIEESSVQDPAKTDRGLKTISGQIELFGYDDGCYVSIYNLQGQLIYCGKEHVISLDSGMYLVRIDGDVYKARI